MNHCTVALKVGPSAALKRHPAVLASAIPPSAGTSFALRCRLNVIFCPFWKVMNAADGHMSVPLKIVKREVSILACARNWVVK